MTFKLGKELLLSMTTELKLLLPDGLTAKLGGIIIISQGPSSSLLFIKGRSKGLGFFVYYALFTSTGIKISTGGNEF